MRTEDIRNLLVVADSRSLVEAAHKLGTAQPTLSKSIARLERALGAAVIRRLPRGVELTEAGRTFVERAREVDLGLADAIAAVRELRFGRTGSVRVGVGVSVPPALVRAACASALRDTRLTIEVIGGMSDSLAAAVASGASDFAITNEPHGAGPLRWHRLFADPMVPVVGARHPLARARRVDWPALAAQTWVVPATGTAVRAWFDALFVQRGLSPPERVVSMRDYFATPGFAEALGAVALTPASYLHTDGDSRRHRALVPPSDWRSTRSVGLLQRGDDRRSPGAARLIDAFGAAAKALFG